MIRRWRFPPTLHRSPTLMVFADRTRARLVELHSYLFGNRFSVGSHGQSKHSCTQPAGPSRPVDRLLRADTHHCRRRRSHRRCSGTLRLGSEPFIRYEAATGRIPNASAERVMLRPRRWLTNNGGGSASHADDRSYSAESCCTCCDDLGPHSLRVFA